MTDPFARLGSAMVRARWVVVAIWLVVLAVTGGFFAPKASKELKAGGFIAANSESDRATTILEREFNASTNNNIFVVLRSDSQTSDAAAFKQAVLDTAGRVKGAHGVTNVETFYDANLPQLISPDRHTTVMVVSLAGDEGAVQEEVDGVRAAVGDPPLEHYVTGYGAINHDNQITSQEDLHRSEMFTIPIVLLLLLFVFRTVIASAIPLVLGACSVVTSLAVIYFIGSNTNVSIFALNVTSMIGLGLGIDFSLIIVSRFRDEMAHAPSVGDAIARTMATAGRSVTYSAVTVMLGMLLMTLFFNLMIVRSISMAVMLVAFTALLSALTLLPALLAILGHRIEWLRVVPHGKPRQPGETGFWYRLSHAIMRRPWVWLGVSLAILLALAVPAREIDLYGSTPGVLPQNVESVRGIKVLSDAVGPTELEPIQVVMTTGQQGGAFTPQFLGGLQRLTDAIAADPRVSQVFSLATAARDAGLPPDQFTSLTPDLLTADPVRAKQAAQLVNLDGNRNTAVITVFAKTGQFTSEHQSLISDLRHTIVPGIPEVQPFTVAVGGSAAVFIDYRDALYGRFPLLVLAVMAMTFVILMMFFQSVLLPLKAILMNLASILATYGVLVLIFQHGWGTRLLGFEPIGLLSVVTPAILFVILFGMSTDYEVFMLSRVKEYYHALHDNEEAVAAGLENTARVITAAGLILVGTFGSFAIARVVTIKEIGLGLAIGVLLDSTIVRVIMVPATMRLMGHWNWWMPAWLKKIVPELSEGPSIIPVPAHAPAMAAADGAATIDMRSGATIRVPSPRTAVALRQAGQLRPLGASVGADLIMLPHARPFRIGRDDDNELQLFDGRISRRHARIDYINNDFVLFDEGSANGVYVNQKRIDRPTVLQDGDRIELGKMDNLAFVFEVRPSAAPSMLFAPS